MHTLKGLENVFAGQDKETIMKKVRFKSLYGEKIGDPAAAMFEVAGGRSNDPVMMLTRIMREELRTKGVKVSCPDAAACGLIDPPRRGRGRSAIEIQAVPGLEGSLASELESALEVTA